MLNTHVTWEGLKQGKYTHLLLSILDRMYVDSQLLYGLVPTERTNRNAVHIAVVELRNDLVASKPFNESVLLVLGLQCTVA